VKPPLPSWESDCWPRDSEDHKKQINNSCSDSKFPVWVASYFCKFWYSVDKIFGEIRNCLSAASFSNFQKWVVNRIQNEQTKEEPFISFQLWKEMRNRNTGFLPSQEWQKLRNAGLLRASQWLKNMWKLEPLNLAIRARNPDYYDKSRDMETAIAWNAVKKTLAEVGREELFGYIKSVKLTEKNVVITTGKPVANAELKIYREQLLESVNQGLGGIGVMNREKLLLK